MGARCLEALGHEVIVADPNFAPMNAARTRKVKTDRHGARAGPRRACSARTTPPIGSPTPSGTWGPLGGPVRPRPDPHVPRLRSVPSAGPVTTAAFIAAIDDAQRFRHAHQLEAYLGLVPREYSSGETQRRGAITKTGHSRTRWLLFQAAVSGSQHEGAAGRCHRVTPGSDMRREGTRRSPDTSDGIRRPALTPGPARRDDGGL
jgi:hypothetical protein